MKFAENIFRIGELKIIASWGDEPKILPATVCANLTSNVGWSIGTAVLPEDENSAIEIRPSDIPKSMREDEVDQSEEEETVEEHLDDGDVQVQQLAIKILIDSGVGFKDSKGKNKVILTILLEIMYSV